MFRLWLQPFLNLRNFSSIFYVFWVQLVQKLFIGPRPQGQGIFQDFIIWFDLSYDLGEDEVLFVKIGARVLDLRLDMSFELKCPNLVYRPQTPTQRYVLKFHGFVEFMLWFWRKWSPDCENLSQGSRLMSTSCPKRVFKSQTPRSKGFLEFHSFIGFILWLWKNSGPVCENWSQSSRLMAWYVF